MCTKRAISEDGVFRTLVEPALTEPDPNHPGRIRAWRRIGEFDDRMLRVVYEEEQDGLVVITAVWDRNAGRR